jgi:lysine-N-methylase
VQNWDCHQGGSCCQEYVVKLSDDERERIEKQAWKTEELGGHTPIRQVGPFWNRRTILNHTTDGSCVFLNEQGRCRIHERFGFEAKPLPCRLFPFVLIPAGDHWAVGIRFACPSAAANLGRPMAEHHAELVDFATLLAQREGLKRRPEDGALTAPPLLGPGQKMSWPDLHRVVQSLLTLLRNRTDPLERRLRKCLAFVRELRQARLQGIEGARLAELLDILRGVADTETPTDPLSLPRPRAFGRMLFRLAAALFTRKDHGPNRGIARQGRLALMRAAWRSVRGRGPVPRTHGAFGDVTFEQAEEAAGPLPPQAAEVLDRYYLIKVASLQFFGPACYGLPFWEGFELLALTFPVICWTTRLLGNRPAEEAVRLAVGIVDDHFGFNRLLGSLRQRLSLSILARTGELNALVAWYSR